jgi:hypothetical protein
MVTFILESNGEEQDNNRRLYYTRLLCNAAIESGILQLKHLTTTLPITIPHKGEMSNTLAASSYFGMQSSLQRLIEIGARDMVTYLGSALTYAVLASNAEMVRTVLRSNTSTLKSILAAIETAARYGNLEILHLLLDFKGPIVGFKRYHRAIRYAALGGHVHILEFLLREDHMCHKPISSLSMSQIIAGLKPCFIYGSEPKEFWLETILISACSAGKDLVVCMVQERGVDITGFGKYEFAQRMPIDVAAQGGHENVVRFILSRGNLVDDINSRWIISRCLLEAARGGWVRISELLISVGADVNWGRTEMGSAWAQAALGGHVDLLSSLIDHGADIEGDKGRLDMVIEQAMQSGYSSIVHILTTNQSGSSRNNDR